MSGSAAWDHTRIVERPGRCVCVYMQTKHHVSQYVFSGRAAQSCSAAEPLSLIYLAAPPLAQGTGLQFSGPAAHTGNMVALSGEAAYARAGALHALFST